MAEPIGAINCEDLRDGRIGSLAARAATHRIAKAKYLDDVFDAKSGKSKLGRPATETVHSQSGSEAKNVGVVPGSAGTELKRAPEANTSACQIS
jgi:hypothetical protein